MDSLENVQSDVKMCFMAMINQIQLANPAIPVWTNWPEPDHRKTISQSTWTDLRTWFISTFPSLPEVSPFYPQQVPPAVSGYTYQGATSGTDGDKGVHDLKIAPYPTGASVFNYHVTVVLSCEDRMTAWTTQFAIECVIAVLTAVGVKFRNTINWGKVIETLMENSVIKKALQTLIDEGVSATGLYVFFKAIYEQDILKFILSEVADLSPIGLAILLTSIAIDFIPGIGEAKLIILLGISAASVVYIYTQKPKC